MSAFPFSALVGMEELKLALVLGAVDHRIGGVLLRGDKGSAKTTAARGLATLLPGDAPFVELPLGATEDRVAGSFDVRAALGTGEYRYRPGLLEAADGGVLYVDEVNLLADHLVDLLLDAAATGVARVERDGVSETRAARFVLVGSMNPEEGELRPQLLDRFGLSVEVTTAADPAMRAEAVRRRLAFDRDPKAMVEDWGDQERELAARLAGVRPACLPDRLMVEVAELCAAAGAQGLRADLVVCRAAAALAGWEGRRETTRDDVNRVAPLALAHRRRDPWETIEPPRRHPGAATPFTHERPSDDARGPGSVPPGPAPDRVDGPRDPGGRQSGHEGGSPDPTPDPHETAQAGGDRSPSTESGGGEATQPHPPDQPPISVATGGRGRRILAAPVEASRGRLVGSRKPDAEGGPVSVHATGTVLAAAGRHRGPGRLQVTEGDLREPVRTQIPSTLVVMVVDASGSMGVRERLAAARAAVFTFLVDAYQRRDRVALVTFRGDGAETVLRPTASTEVARARLESMATGGRTPLAAGIRQGLSVASSRRHATDRPLLVIVTDGRATWGENGDDPVEAALVAAAEVKASGVDALVVDCESGQRPLGLTRALADTMGARRVVVGHLTGGALSAAVRSALA